MIAGEAERVQAALGEAEGELQRLVDARVAVTEVLAGLPLVVMGSTESAVAGSTVPPAGVGRGRENPRAVLPADLGGAGV